MRPAEQEYEITGRTRRQRVRTHQQSRVESSPIQPSQTQQRCRVKSLDAASFIFVSQTPVIGREGRNGCRGAYSFS